MKNKRLTRLFAVAMALTLILSLSVTSVSAASQKIGFGKATNLVTRDYTYIGKAVDTFTWTFDGRTNKITSATAKQSCSGIKSVSTLSRKSIKCTRKTDKVWYYTSVYYLSLPKPIKKLSGFKFATITVKYELSAKKLKVASRTWKWSLKETW